MDQQIETYAPPNKHVSFFVICSGTERRLLASLLLRLPRQHIPLAASGAAATSGIQSMRRPVQWPVAAAQFRPVPTVR